MEAMLGFWLAGVLWANPALPPPEIESRTLFALARKINFGTANLSNTNTDHLYVFVIHKQKLILGMPQ
jgi:hypothetical protein